MYTVVTFPRFHVLTYLFSKLYNFFIYYGTQCISTLIFSYVANAATYNKNEYHSSSSGHPMPNKIGGALSISSNRKTCWKFLYWVAVLKIQYVGLKMATRVIKNRTKIIFSNFMLHIVSLVLNLQKWQIILSLSLKYTCIVTI